jgi:hypothetical protein
LHSSIRGGANGRNRSYAAIVLKPHSVTEEFTHMSTAHEVRYPADMTYAARTEPAHWAESTIHSVVDSVEDYARAKPLAFGMWTFVIGFTLGWKLKFW